MVRGRVQPRPWCSSPGWSVASSASACAAGASCPGAGGRRPRSSSSTSARRACGPRRRRAASQIAAHGAAAVPAVDAVPGPRRVRRRRAGRVVLDAAAEATAARRRAGRPPSASPTSGRARSCGTARRASRSPRRSAGRTCAPSASASRPRPSTACPAPNQSATKVAWLLDHVDGRRATATCASAPSTPGSPGRCRAARSTSPTTPTPRVTGLLALDGGRVERAGARRCSASRRDAAAIVDSSGVIGEATALPGAPPIAALVGDQQASLVGQGCVDAGAGQDHVRHGRDARRVRRRRNRPPSAQRSRARHVPDRRLVPRRRRSRGAPRRSCCRPARTSSGCATTSA